MSINFNTLELLEEEAKNNETVSVDSKTLLDMIEAVKYFDYCYNDIMKNMGVLEGERDELARKYIAMKEKGCCEDDD